jgi:hypothetical protein
LIEVPKRKKIVYIHISSSSVADASLRLASNKKIGKVMPMSSI